MTIRLKGTLSNRVICNVEPVEIRLADGSVIKGWIGTDRNYVYHPTEWEPISECWEDVTECCEFNQTFNRGSLINYGGPDKGGQYVIAELCAGVQSYRLRKISLINGMPSGKTRHCFIVEREVNG